MEIKAMHVRVCDSDALAPKFTLSAKPSLILEGQFKGELRCVEFHAASPTETIQWFAINCGQFEAAFRQFLPRTLALGIVDALARGEAVEFPGRYRREMFDEGFHYQWSPVSSSSPRSFFQVCEREAEVTI